MHKYYFTTKAFKAYNYDLPEEDARYSKFFGAGKLIIGTEETIQGDRVITTQDGYSLPETNLREVQDPAAIESLQNMQKNVNDIMSRNIVTDIVRTNKYSMGGSSAGAVLGIIAGILTGKNIFWCGFIGTVGGGVVGYGFSKFKKD